MNLLTHLIYFLDLVIACVRCVDYFQVSALHQIKLIEIFSLSRVRRSLIELVINVKQNNFVVYERLAVSMLIITNQQPNL